MKKNIKTRLKKLYDETIDQESPAPDLLGQYSAGFRGVPDATHLILTEWFSIILLSSSAQAS